MFTKSGKVLYEGDFSNHLFEGKGTLLFDTGIKEYEGDFLGGQRHGKGTGFHKNGKVKKKKLLFFKFFTF